MIKELPDIHLPYELRNGKATRDLIGTIVKAYWKAVNEWTSASNNGLNQLKSVIGILVNLPGEDLPSKIHSECQELNSAVDIMKKTLKTMHELEEELRKVIALQEVAVPGFSIEPLFSTILPKRFYDILVKSSERFSKETEIKIHACKPLPYTTDVETLNACITLWTNSLYLIQPHLYHVKILLHESKLL